MAISTSDLTLMPDIETFRRTLKAIAMLEMILHIESGYEGPPNHRFDSRWGLGEELASWDNQQGDSYFVVFNGAGCWMKGFTHEAQMSPFRTKPPRTWPGMFQGLPKEFEKYVTEPAFDADKATTFSIWRLNTDAQWRRGDLALPARSVTGHPAFRDADLSGMVLSEFERDADAWAQYEEENYEQEHPIERGAVRHLFNLTPWTQTVVCGIHSEASPKGCREAAEMIGYPIDATFAA